MNEAEDMTRRKLLSQTTGAILAGATLSIPTSTKARAAAGDDRKVGFAMVGLGGYAMNQLIPSIGSCDKAKLVALVSGHRDKARQVAKRYGVDAKNIYNYETYDTIKDNPDVDVIYIVLPNGMHAEYAIRGAKAGKHIMCEKPMANTVEECQAMINACRQAGRKLMIGYRCHYEATNLEAIRIVRSGEIGKLVAFTSDHGFRINDPAVWWLNKKLAGGGPLMDIGIYGLNAARYISGEEPTDISAFTYASPDDPRFKDVEETCVWQMRFPSGALATCTTSYDYAYQNNYRAIGTTGWINMQPATNYSDNRLTRSSGGDVRIRENNQFAAEMDHFANCVLNDKAPRTPGEEGLRDVRIMMAIYEAARTGKTVRLGTG